MACGGANPVAGTQDTQLGGPNPGLAPSVLASFQRGKAVFERRFTRSEGHGPDFTTSSCRSCHEIPVSGGSSPLYRNFFLVGSLATGDFTPILDGDQFVARTFSYERTMREAIPPGADVAAQRNAPPMFGVGRFESIPAADILANRDPDDFDGDGISGRENLDNAQIGRFGYKAQESGLEDFVRGPIFNHLGITTNPLFVGPALRAEPQIAVPGTPTTDTDGVPDPELGFFDLADLVTYTRELAPPAPLPMDGTAQRGEELFETVGCAKCHIPNIVRDGPPLFAYTDLLLHDMGIELADSVMMGHATGSEFRTQPLWGLRHHAPYLHNGRADTIEEAILLHGGEAAAVRDAFAQLPGDDRDAILRFLETR
jgi:CxxC motif-containing protein (DUF1111 family)